MINDDQQIKMMILFALRSAGCPLPSVTIAQILNECGIGQIGTSGELYDLEEKGHVSLITDDDTEYAVLQKTGTEIVTALGRDLSPTLREKIILATAKEVAKLRKDLGVSASCREKPDGGFDVLFSLTDEGSPLMELTMYAPTKAQADIMISAFKDDPYRVYRDIITSLSKCDN
ncbi:MAG: DUF4364 family protein [Clostridia bacterium]|nr:DUF4364 family protein [Clostridia bacterium]